MFADATDPAQGPPEWSALIRAYHNGNFNISPDRIASGGGDFESQLAVMTEQLGRPPDLSELMPPTRAFEVMTRPHAGLIGHLGRAHAQASELGHDPLWLECALARFLCQLSHGTLVPSEEQNALFSFNIRMGGYDPVRLDGLRQILRYYHALDASLLSHVAFEIIEDLQLSPSLLKALRALSEIFDIRFLIDDVGSCNHDAVHCADYLKLLLDALGDRLIGYKIDYGLNRTMMDHAHTRSHVQANLAALRRMDPSPDRILIYEGATQSNRLTLKPAQWFQNTREDGMAQDFSTIWYQLG